ncbi:MAG: methyl-accepting chemotaxis protein [Spirochaetia bacterium]
MKKSILTRLIGGYILLLVTIALLAVCFAFGVRVDRIAADDARRLTAILERVQAITLGASRISTDATPELLRQHAEQMHSADTELLRLAAERPRTVEGALIYPPEVRENLTVALAVLGASWQVELQHVLDAGDHAFDSAEARDRLVALVPAFIESGANTAAQLAASVNQVYDARRNLTSSVLALFALFLGVGTLSALAYSLWTLFVLRRDVRALVAFSRKVSEGEVSGLPEVKRSDEIGELAAQLRQMISLQTLVAALRASGERLAAEHAKVTDRITRAVSGVKSQVKAAEEASRGFTGVADSVKRVEENAAAGRDAARQGSAAVKLSLEKITTGMEGTRALEERTARIEDAVSVIGDVADQTELLSLNAAIEAARAGEAGRGFTVVAQQVRKLADRSARSASEIADLVQSVLEGVRRISDVSKESLETGQLLHKELEKVRAASGSMTELARAAADGVGRAESSLGAMLGVAVDTSRKVDDLAASSRSMHEIIGEIERALEQFSLGSRSAEPRGPEPVVSFLPGETRTLPLSLGITPVSPQEEAVLVRDIPPGEPAAAGEEEIEELEAADD